MTVDRALIVRWRWVIAYTALVYVTLPLAPAMRRVAVDLGGPRVFTWIVLGALAAAALWLARWLARGGLQAGHDGPAERRLSRLASWGFVGLAYLGLLVKFGSIPVEQIHIVMYAVMGVLVYMALDKRRSQRSVFARAVGIVFAIGFVDELIQEVLPTRVYDVRDILMNGVTGIFTQLTILLARADRYSELPPSLLVRAPRPDAA